MKLGIILTMERGPEGPPATFQAIQALALAAERAGLDSIWLPDHLLRSPRGEVFWDAFTMLGALAASTTRITLGTIVASTSFRPPALVAKIADTLDAISGGRLILGLGAGWYQPEYEAFGYPFDHLAGRFEEALQIIAPLLREGQVDFQGQYYQAHHCVLHPRGPSRHGPPLMIAGRRPRMLQLAARYADAWNNAWHVDPTTMQASYEEFKQACAIVGRDPATVEVTLATMVKLLSAGEQVEETRAITGAPEAIADRLASFARAGVSQVIALLEPLTLESIEEFGYIVEGVHRHNPGDTLRAVTESEQG
jgi:alkanesulfonate monooxygenase SsuD/methylene tetrahydromethanopterin reductase-like flavin-dependent oxidoreductase (luciferase family)